MKNLLTRATALLILVGAHWPNSAYAQAQNPFQANIRTTDPLTPDQEQKSFTLPPGFDIQLVAAEPDVHKPLNMAFDARGRLWVTDTVEYPYPAPPDRPGRDTVKILEDTTGDGRADKITTFADGLNIPIGVIPHRDGAIVFSIPNIEYLKDSDGDGKADERIKLLGPFDYSRDTHGLTNSFRLGFDGWIYACHGFNNVSKIAGGDGHEVTLPSGNTYRFRPDGSRVELFTHGQVNPFGMTFDPRGNIFTADCHSMPLYQLLRNGYYPSFGRPHDGLGFAPKMMDHKHGSTAIAGVAFYADDQFPPEYRGNLFSGNVMTSRVNRNSLVYHGSTAIAHEEPDLVTTTDPWFRPVDVRMGPDGALYIADFYNRIIGHYEVPLDHPGRDRTRGRIWRIVYTGDAERSRRKQSPSNLATADVPRLIAALDHENLQQRLAATNRLAEFATHAPATSPNTPPARTALIAVLHAAYNTSASARQKCHLLWVLHRLGGVDPDSLVDAGKSKDSMLRVHAMKVLSETAALSQRQIGLARNGLKDADAFVARAAADALVRHPQADHIRPLLDLLARVPENDTYLRHAVRMSLQSQLKIKGAFADASTNEKFTEQDAREVASIAVAVDNPEAAGYLLDYVAKHELPRNKLLESLSHISRYARDGATAAVRRVARKRFPDDMPVQQSILEAVHEGRARRGLPPDDAMKDWATDVVTELLKSDDRKLIPWSAVARGDGTATPSPWVIQQRPSDDGQTSLFFSSLPRGERLTGTYRSGEFVIPDRFHFYSAGHVGPPGEPVQAHNFVRLRDAATDEILAEAKAPRHDVARKIEWDLEGYAGRRGYLELVDGDARPAFAWLAVGRFSIAALNPSRLPARRRAAASLAARFRLTGFSDTMMQLVRSPESDVETSFQAAQALMSFRPETRIASLVGLLADPGVPAQLRDRILTLAAAHAESDEAAAGAQVGELLAAAMQSIPTRLQRSVAESLVVDRTGAVALLELIERGKASARLLESPRVAQRLDALKFPGKDRRLKALTAGLPSVDAELQALIVSRRDEFRRRRSELCAERGAAVFKKQCANCHRVANEGAMIGPQLDGVGNRGLERVLEDVLDPNRNVDVAFRSTTLVLTSGKIRTGLFRREAGETLVLVDEKGKEFTVPKDDVEVQKKSRVSHMPANVAEVVPQGDFLDLIAWLLTQTASRENEKFK